MIFGLLDFLWNFWTFLDGLSLECLWTAWNGFQCELNGFRQPFVCVGRSRKPWPTERWKSSTGSYWSHIYWVFLLVFFWHSPLWSFPKAAIQTANNSNSLELTVEDEAGDVIYWTITRQMYHIREKCPIHTATSMGRTARSCDVCQVCRPEIGVLVTVSSTGSKYHRRDCRTVSKSTPLELVRCPICFDIKAEWMNL